MKEDMAVASMLAYFDRGAPTYVITDTSPVGLGTILVKEVDEERRAVFYDSRSLSDTERRYTQLKRKHLRLFGPVKDLICTL